MMSGSPSSGSADWRHQIRALSESFAQLHLRLAQAAKDLHDPGLPPPADLQLALTAAERDFSALRAQLIEAARQARAAPLPEAAQLASLKDLAGFWQEVLDPQLKANVEAARQQALRALERVAWLTHTDKPEFAPLADCQAKGRELQTALAAADWAQPQPALTARFQPFAALLKIVEEGDSLDDESLEHLHSLTEQAFGKLLTVAAARGRLVVREPAAAAAPEEAAKLAVAAEGPAATLPVEAAPAPAEATPPPETAPQVEVLPIEPQALPQHVAELYALLGHAVQKMVPRSEHMVDLIIRSSTGKKWMARCRSQAENVGETEVRDFYSVMHQEKAAQGAIVTLGGFTPQARQWAKDNLLYLLDKDEFADYLRQARAASKRPT